MLPAVSSDVAVEMAEPTKPSERRKKVPPLSMLEMRKKRQADAENNRSQDLNEAEEEDLEYWSEDENHLNSGATHPLATIHFH